MHAKQKSNLKVNIPLVDLEKAARKAKRMFVRRKFRGGVLVEMPYKAPSLKTPNSMLRDCTDCGRRCTGWQCRECFRAAALELYEDKVRAEDERVSKNEAAYLNVIKKEPHMSRTKKNAIASPITRSTSGLRTALFEEMEALRNGGSNAQRARSVAMMANSILQSVQVEIEYHKYVNSNQGKVVGDSKVVSLGTDMSLAA